MKDGKKPFAISNYSLDQEKSNGKEQFAHSLSNEKLQALAQRKPNLEFSTDIPGAIEAADLIFVCVNTPAQVSTAFILSTNTNLAQSAKDGSDFDIDLAYQDVAMKAIAENSRSHKIIAIKSTVPCGTAEHIQNYLTKTSLPQASFTVLSCPEFLAQGTTLKDLIDPDRVIIGSVSQDPKELADCSSLVGLYRAWVPQERIITMSLFSCELTKLAHNAFLAQRVSSINSLSAICELRGADINDVSHGLGMNKRIGSKYLEAGLGFGGSCLMKDTASLIYLAASMGLTEVADYWRQVLIMNDYQKARFARRIISTLGNEPKGNKVAILGFAYKRETRDSRGTPTKDVILHLLRANVSVALYDPHISLTQVQYELGDEFLPSAAHSTFSKASSAIEACSGADAIVLLNNAEKFISELDLQQISLNMRASRYVFFGHGPVDSIELSRYGFEGVFVGKE